ncbi:hypothetical protein ZWY2020_033217 [Hordeum vulgare]|nr:hypothetical protein ZWY2020_033217 [Hordeum vulgare]
MAVRTCRKKNHDREARDTSCTVPILLWGSLLLVAGRAACHSTVASSRTQESPSHKRQTRHGPPGSCGSRSAPSPAPGRQAMMPLERYRSLYECVEQKRCTVEAIPTGFLSLSSHLVSAFHVSRGPTLMSIVYAVNGMESPTAVATSKGTTRVVRVEQI